MGRYNSTALRVSLVFFSVLIAACAGDDNNSESPPPAAAPGPVVLGVERAFANLAFSQPVALLQAPADSDHWFVVEQAGRVLVFANHPEVATSGIFADITDRVALDGEMGLLGMAFHPNFPANPLVYLSYSNITDGNRVNRVSEFRLRAGGTVDPTSERILMSVEQPEGNHNGGQIAFGLDGYLYIARGDGGGANDQHGPFGNAQVLTTLLGKMLRIDVSPRSGYAIPPDNPFSGVTVQCGAGGTGSQNCPEVFAWGFRNPWRWSFDRATGALWVGDVGQAEREEIDRVLPGGNYGWRCFEGTHDTALPCGAVTNFLPPVAEYGRAEGATVIGGYVYRGSAIPGLVGRYVFGDFTSGRIWHIDADTQPTTMITGGLETNLLISSFGQGIDGELYIVDYRGPLYGLVSR
jgi:glucose/arabinose dehydrogenase